MRFERAVLIKRVKDEIAERERAVAEVNQREAEKFAAGADEHVAATSEAWRLFANRIRSRVRTGTPVTYGDVPDEIKGPRGWVDQLRFYEEGPTEREANVAGLKATLAALEACEDEVITTTALGRIGIKAGDLFR